MTEVLKHLSQQQENLSLVGTSVLLGSLHQYENALDFLKQEGRSNTVFAAVVAERIKALKEELRRRGVDVE